MSRVIWAKYLILLLKTAIFMVEKIQKHIRAQKLDYNPVLIQYFMGKLVKRFGLAMIGLQSIGGSKIGGKHILCSNFAKFCSLIFITFQFFFKSQFFEIYDILSCKKDHYNISYDVFHFLKICNFQTFLL